MAIEKRSTAPDNKPNKWRIRVNRNGKRYEMNFFGNLKQAKLAEHDFINKINQGNMGTNENIRLCDLIDIVTEDYIKKELKTNTKRIHANSSIKIKDYFKTTRVCDIKPYDIQVFVNTLSEKYKPNTVGGIISTLSVVLGKGEQWELISKNPYKNISLPTPEDKSKTELMSIDDIRKLLHLYENEKNLMHKAAFYLAIFCGLRNSEIRALTLDDIDFDNNVIDVNKQIADTDKEKEVVTSTKTLGSNRKVYAPAAVIDTIEKYKDTLPYIPIDGKLFFNYSTGKYITKHCLSKRFRVMLPDNNLPTIRFHDLRHLQATLLMYSDVNIQAISQRLGHSNTNTTLRAYTHTINEFDKQAVGQLENTIKKIKG